MASVALDSRQPSPLDRFLRLFAEVRPGESATALLLLLNLFLLLVGYYVVKTVREPLILATGGAEVKSYAAAGQALLLMGFVPLYSWFSSRVDREKLVLGVTLFFIVNVELFFVGAKLGVPYLGVVFYIWVGIFSLATIAQFWSYANDLYVREAGERLFAIIAVGATAGGPVGAKLAETMFRMKVSPFDMLHVTAGILALQLAVYWIVNRRETLDKAERPQALVGSGGFALVFRSRYLMLMAVLLVILNIVNTTGEYILGRSVVMHADAMAAADPSFQKESYIGEFYGGFNFAVTMLTFLVQVFVVSRMVRFLGIAGIVLFAPLLSLGAYGIVAAGAAFTVLRWAKVFENATDYSVTNTGKQMLWLPTTRDEKYKAKQAIDTFFVRSGDLLSAGGVYLGTHLLGLGVMGFAGANVAFALAWLGVAGLLLREEKRVIAMQGAGAAAAGVH
jgi:ATP:ADP antiporter, AAA family